MEFGINDHLNFCIMTSSNYLTKALVMYDSLIKECNGEFKFFYFTFDKETYKYLVELNYKNIIPIPLHDLEQFYPELKNTQSTRNNAEYFFTCTPHIVDYALKKFDINHIIYLDADLYFYQSPTLILNELIDNSVLITEHRYFPPNKGVNKSGKYCVQFIPFMKDEIGIKVITWWKEKCIEWCYTRAENGKWADQGYLNDWPELFEKIIVMKNRGGGVAPWNIDAYTLYKDKYKLRAFNEEIKTDIDIIFYHFQGLKIYSNKLITLGIPKRKKNAYEFIYKDYLNKLSEKENELLQIINISRKDFNYQKYPYSFFRALFGEIRRFILPRKNDLIFYYKYLNRYKWLH